MPGQGRLPAEVAPGPSGLYERLNLPNLPLQRHTGIDLGDSLRGGNAQHAVLSEVEMALEDVLAQMGIRTPAEANEFIREQLVLVAGRIRETLPDYPADWYRIEVARQREEERLAEIRAKREG